MDTLIDAPRLRGFMERAFRAEGFDAREAAQIADVLMQADLFAIESHGAQRMMYYHRNIASGSVAVGAQAEVLRETPVSALLDGRFAMGQLTARRAMAMAIEKAKASGVGMVAVRNSSHYADGRARGAGLLLDDQHRPHHDADLRAGDDAGHQPAGLLYASRPRALLV